MFNIETIERDMINVINKTLLKVRKRINSQINFVEVRRIRMEVRELKTELFAENCPEKSPLFIERIKIRAPGGYSLPALAYLPERGKGFLSFFSSSSPVSQPSSPLALFSPPNLFDVLCVLRRGRDQQST